MKFASAHMAVLLWLIPAMIVFYRLAFRSRMRVTERFASGSALNEISGSVDMRRKKLKAWMLTVSVFFIVLALMRPQWGFKWQEVKRQALDIVIALDTSKSMLAEDVLPNRLRRAKLAIMDLIKKLRGDRVALIVFSGRAFLQCPLTIDYDGFLLSLDDVSVETVPVGGTALAKAIYAATDSYEGGKKKNKVLIIITDGEDLEGGLEEAAKRAKAEGIVVYCVGIGASEGELIPVTDTSGKRAFLKDQEGNVVKTRLVENTLQSLALETGGIYVRATGAEFGLDLIYQEKLSKLDKEEFKSKMEKRYNERFYFPLSAAILLLVIETLIGDRKRNKGRKV